MSEMKHWLDTASDATDFERAVLRSGLDVDPPAGRREEVWALLAGSLSLTPLEAITNPRSTVQPAARAASSALSAGKITTVCLGVGKGFIAGLALYGAVSGVSELARRPSSRSPDIRVAAVRAVEPARSASSSAAAPPAFRTLQAPAQAAKPNAKNAKPQAAGAAVRVEPSTPRTLDAAPSVASFTDPPQNDERDASQLAAEARALREARAQLRAGRFATAFATLEAARHQFSAPELYQEREALMIELLGRSGQGASASLRAQAFLAQFPESPHADQVRQFLRSPSGQ